MFGTKKAKGLILIGAAALMLTGCAGFADSDVYAIPANAPELKTSIVADERYSDEYRSISYGGRKYVYFGTAAGLIKDKEISACVGYADGGRDDRVYTLKDTRDYIMRRNAGGFMEQPDFYRAADTAGRSVFTPDYIVDLEKPIWR